MLQPNSLYKLNLTEPYASHTTLVMILAAGRASDVLVLASFSEAALPGLPALAHDISPLHCST